MIDKKIELDIKAVKSFIEFWEKFHSVYNGTISKEIITKDDEVRFLETKEVISKNYSRLRESFEYKYMPHGRMTDPVSDILSLDNMRLMSEASLKKVNDNWKDSYIFLNNILERLKYNRKRMERFSPIGVFLKRMFTR